MALILSLHQLLHNLFYYHQLLVYLVLHHFRFVRLNLCLLAVLYAGIIVAQAAVGLQDVAAINEARLGVCAAGRAAIVDVTEASACVAAQVAGYLSQSALSLLNLDEAVEVGVDLG